MLKEKLKVLPKDPGCYLMLNSKKEVLYVGKAKTLRSRVRSYFNKNHDTKTAKLVSQITDIEFIVTNTSLEALILESNLIKQYKPRYNILLKDDKTYPYIKLTKEKYPRLEITRKLIKDGSNYFGPYPNVKDAVKTKRLLDRLFPLRKCKVLPKQTCLYYHLEQCLAPCVYNIDPANFKDIAQKIKKFLKGEHTSVKKELKTRMLQAADELKFETAQEIKELIESIDRTTRHKQNIILTEHQNLDIDIFGFAANDEHICIQVFMLRQGKLIERESVHFTRFNTQISEAQDELLTFITQFYKQHEYVLMPDQILISPEVDIDILKQLLPGTVIQSPLSGYKNKLVNMATLNAQTALSLQSTLRQKDPDKTLKNLSQLLGLGESTLHRIEAYDNSHLQGSDASSVMVVFLDGKPAKAEYRKFKLSLTNKSNDTAAMQEVIRRRYKKVLIDNLEHADLILVDGGKSQVAAAREVLEDELGLFIPVAGMAKNSKHKTSKLISGSPTIEINIKTNSSEFKLIERIQLEVHRFAIDFHRNRRSKSMLKSSLDDIPGIGIKRKQNLYKKFGSIESIKTASIESLKEAGISAKLAEQLLKHLNQ